MRTTPLLIAIALLGLASLPAAAKPAPADRSAYNANSYDPAGNYKGHPDWARRAFAGKGTSR